MGSSQQKNARVGLLSRIDYGSHGFRKALVLSAFDYFQEEGTHYNILAGGLVAKTPLTEEMRAFIKEKFEPLAELKKMKRFAELSPGLIRAKRKDELEKDFCLKIAAELAKIIPVMKIPDPANPRKEKMVDLFVVTSPTFDGDIGRQVADFLGELRSDVRIWNEGGDRFPVLYVDKLIWVLTPQKGIFMRSDFYSTPAERLIKDKIKQTTQSAPDVYVVGCLASAINKPKGELPYSYVTVPACHRLEETRTSENQVGASILEFLSGSNHYLYRTRSLKDIVSRELEFVVPPSEATPLERRIIEYMKKKGSATPGLLKYALPDASKKSIDQAIKKLMEARTVRRLGENFPGITYQERSKKFYFDLEWIRNHFKYGRQSAHLLEDSILAFCCLHVGSIETDYDFFVTEVPKIILKQKAKFLVNAGDTKEGLEHDLDKKGEVIAGLNNNTKQEKVAANIIGEVIFRVFCGYFKECVGNKNPKSLNVDELVSHCLILYAYCLGNHDLWETKHGHDPLELFHISLISFLVEKIGGFLAKYGLYCHNLHNLVDQKVLRRDFFELPSGLKVSLQHPHMARAKTTSIRPQEMLDYAKRFQCQVAIGGNFHVAEVVPEWDVSLGQCVCLELGTIKHGSSFERHKMKMVDQGVGLLRIFSHDKRIINLESSFIGALSIAPQVDNTNILNEFMKRFGVSPIKNI